MKIQTISNDELQIKTSGATAILLGVIFLVVGVVVAVLVHSSSGKSSGNPLIGMAFGGVFAVVGLLLVLFASSERIVLRRGGTSTVEKKRLLGGKTVSQNFDTVTVQAVHLMTGFSAANVNPAGGGFYNNMNGNRQSRLELLLNDGSVVHIADQTGSSSTINGINVTNLITKAPLSKEANQIADFLGVPLQNEDITNPMGAIKQVGQAVGESFAAAQNHQQTPFTQQPATSHPQEGAPQPVPAQPAEAPAQSPQNGQ